jgi:hypothetical protein
VNRVGGDESELLDLFVRSQFGGLVPPKHDKVPGVGLEFLEGAAEGFDVTIAESLAHAGGSEKGRIPHDEITLRPLRPPWVHVFIKQLPRGFIRDFLIGDGWVLLLWPSLIVVGFPSLSRSGIFLSKARTASQHWVEFADLRSGRCLVSALPVVLSQYFLKRSFGLSGIVRPDEGRMIIADAEKETNAERVGAGGHFLGEIGVGILLEFQKTSFAFLKVKMKFGLAVPKHVEREDPGEKRGGSRSNPTSESCTRAPLWSDSFFLHRYHFFLACATSPHISRYALSAESLLIPPHFSTSLFH